jgi:hypothetical protein
MVLTVFVYVCLRDTIKPATIINTPMPTSVTAHSWVRARRGPVSTRIRYLENTSNVAAERWTTADTRSLHQRFVPMRRLQLALWELAFYQRRNKQLMWSDIFPPVPPSPDTGKSCEVDALFRYAPPPALNVVQAAGMPFADFVCVEDKVWVFHAEACERLCEDFKQYRAAFMQLVGVWPATTDAEKQLVDATSAVDALLSRSTDDDVSHLMCFTDDGKW